MQATKENINFLNKYSEIISDTQITLNTGTVHQVNGLSIISKGPGDASIGDFVKVQTNINTKDGLLCEVVGFQGHHLILMPLGLPTGVFPNSLVSSLNKKLSISVNEDMLGRVLDGIGRPLDHKPPIYSRNKISVDSSPPLPTDRYPIRKPVVTGIRSIDGLISIGRGQRMGIFAGTGVGKSTLLGMIARNTKADINIICLVGERGREVSEFIENDLGKEGLARSVLFVATSDRSALEKVYAAGFATSTAEFFRDKGYHVNLYLDSITRYVLALREIGIASGEQLGPGGFPPRVWYQLSRLLERAGNLENSSITGFYTILVEADDLLDPVADNSRGFLDGHIVLSRSLANRGHYPSIETTESISRVMDKVIVQDHLTNALRIRKLLSAYKENEELIRLGAYVKGSNNDVDEALDKMNLINSFLLQEVKENSSWDETINSMEAIVNPTEVITY